MHYCVISNYRHRNGTAGLWRLPHPTHVYPRSNKCTMFLLSHCQSSLGRYWIVDRYINKFFDMCFFSFSSSVLKQSLPQQLKHRNQMCICDSKSGGTCELWELQDATNVPIWSKICEMCGLQFCDIRWGEYRIRFYSVNQC